MSLTTNGRLDTARRRVAHGITFFLSVGVVLSALSACGGGSGSSTPAAPSGPDYSGSWAGDLSRDTLSRKYVRFTVSGQDITSMSVTMAQFHLSPGGILRGCDNVLTSTSAVRISGSSFQVSVSGAQGSSIVRGTFSSATAATGSVDEYMPVAGCPGTTVAGGLITVSSDTWRGSKQ